MSTDREQLIEEAAKAAREVMARQGVYTHRQERGRTIDEVIADVVLAVFEKAYTPTDDEWADDESEPEQTCAACGRDDVLTESLPYDDNGVGGVVCWGCAAVGVVRRTVQGEPTHDEREAIMNALLNELGWDWDEVPEEHIPSTREILGDMADRVLAVADRFRPTPSELSEALEAMTAEKEKWRKRCAEETIAWADEAAETQRLRSDACTVQGEPAGVAALEAFLGKLAGSGAYTLNFGSANELFEDIVRVLRRDIEALRAAGGAS